MQWEIWLNNLSVGMVDIEGKYNSLKKILSDMHGVVVAYSGGVDSTLLLKAAVDVLGAENVLACIAKGPSFPQREHERALKTAKKIAAMGKASLKAAKECIDRGYDVDLKSGCSMESDSFGLCMASPDGKEGMSAFLEKRKPEFKGERF